MVPKIHQKKSIPFKLHKEVATYIVVTCKRQLKACVTRLKNHAHVPATCIVVTTYHITL